MAVKCPEDPLKLLGQPIGMYHCPYCGCMQIAGLSHMCDSNDCLLDDCECLKGAHQSPNKQAWVESGREPAVEPLPDPS